MSQSNRHERVCVAAVVGAHGVTGLIALRPFTQEPESVVAYGPVETEDGRRRLRLAIAGRAGKGRLLARIEGVDDRDKALALKGERLYVPRDRLPAPDGEDEYYHADVIGLSVADLSGRVIGEVAALHDFGAGDVLVVRDHDGGEMNLPFTRAAVPTVDLDLGRLIVDPPAGLGLVDERHDKAAMGKSEP